MKLIVQIQLQAEDDTTRLLAMMDVNTKSLPSTTTYITEMGHVVDIIVRKPTKEEKQS